MKFLEAKKIQTIVECLNNMNEKTNYKCKVEQHDNTMAYCYLYSGKDSAMEYADLVIFAKALEGMVYNFCTCTDRVTIKINDKYVNSIRCW